MAGFRELEDWTLSTEEQSFHLPLHFGKPFFNSLLPWHPSIVLKLLRSFTLLGSAQDHLSSRSRAVAVVFSGADTTPVAPSFLEHYS